MATCNTLFCILDKHEDDRHTDATGHSWTEPNSEHEVVAHAYALRDAGRLEIIRVTF